MDEVHTHHFVGAREVLAEREADPIAGARRCAVELERELRLSGRSEGEADHEDEKHQPTRAAAELHLWRHEQENYSGCGSPHPRDEPHPLAQAV